MLNPLANHSQEEMLRLQQAQLAVNMQQPIDNTQSRVESQQLLGFSAVPSARQMLVNRAGHEEAVTISAQLGGLFFVAENPWNSRQPDPANADIELTCYRRNLFKVFSTISIPRDAERLAGPGRPVGKISGMSVELSATESLEGKPVKLVLASKTNQVSEEEEPQPLRISLTPSSDLHSNPVPFSIAWERLKFRSATTKTQRKDALPQRYRLSVSVFALTDDGGRTLICESLSVPIVVRGRSPGSFPAPKSVAKIVRNPRSEIHPQTLPFKDDIGLTPPHGLYQTPPPIFHGQGSTIPEQQLLQDPSTLPFQWELGDPWMNIFADNTSASKSLMPSTRQSEPPELHFTHRSMSEIYETSASVASSVTLTKSKNPRDVSNHMENERTLVVTEKRLDTGQRFNETPKFKPQDTPPNNDLEAELSYEYFPLSADDWTVPAQALYRPHRVHHRSVPLSSLVSLNRKRYYIEAE